MITQNSTNENPKKVIIIGAGGHGRVIADIVKLSGDTVLGFLDDRPAEEFPNLCIMGKISNALAFKDTAFFIVGIGDNHIRKNVMESLDLPWYTAIHPSAVIASDVSIGIGTAIMANVVVNTGSSIGNGVILNTVATIDHDSTIGNYVHISPGAHLGGTVTIGERTWIGMGATVINNVNICGKIIVGAGAVVIRHIKNNGVYTGIPAKLMIPK